MKNILTAEQRNNKDKANEELIQQIRKRGFLKSPQIINAFRKVKRIDFVPEDFKDIAYTDIPVPIAEGMTTSQPSTIAFMLEKLQPQAREKILEIGTGSGYQTALLAEIVGTSGKVYSIEFFPELKKFAEDNLKKYKYENTVLYLGDGKKGLPEKAPFNKIIAGAEVRKIPKAWKRQLLIGGSIVTPLDNHVVKTVKVSENKFEEIKFPYFSFVKMR